MKNVCKLIMISITALLISCDTDPILAPGEYVSFEENSKSLSLEVGQSISDELTVIAGGISGADRTFNLIVDEATTIPESSLDLPSSVLIPGGTNQGTVSYTIDYNDELGVTGGDLVVRLEDTRENQLVRRAEVNEDLRDQGSNSQVNILISVVCDTPATVDFVFDGYASETTWSIRDTAGATIYTGGGFSDGRETFTRDICLSDGNYVFVVEDSFGDGLSDPNAGTASVSFNGTVLTEVSGDFGSEFVGEFTIQN
ncbi:MAG: hypothetical protein R6V36_03160 [Psychroflexus sp.]